MNRKHNEVLWTQHAAWNEKTRLNQVIDNLSIKNEEAELNLSGMRAVLVQREAQIKDHVRQLAAAKQQPILDLKKLEVASKEYKIYEDSIYKHFPKAKDQDLRVKMKELYTSGFRDFQMNRLALELNSNLDDCKKKLAICSKLD